MPSKQRQLKHNVSRFTRSVHLERDHLNPDSLVGYVVTAGARRVLTRIAPALQDSAVSRAWTLTGPYGTGKSAFALFASRLFGPSRRSEGLKALELLHLADPKLAQATLGNGKANALWPITITGSREPLHATILRGLGDSLTAFDRKRSRVLLRDISRHAQQANVGKPPSGKQLTDLFASALDVVCSGPGAVGGLFLIIDELGKLLEYAAVHPTGSDVYVLQTLAEFAARAPQPLLILGILHQDFGVYADRLSSKERAEWDKVRGRFEDIVFDEPADEILRLVAQARSVADDTDGNSKSKNGSRPGKPSKSFRSLCETAWDLQIAPAGLSKVEFLDLLGKCWPLHPLVSVVLGQVFRKLAQNERSVFSFLESSEPFGLTEHFENPNYSPDSLYGVDRLYDYLVHSLGDGLYLQSHGKRWAEIESILARLPDANHTDVLLIKAIGFLGAMGQWRSIRATPDLLRFAAHGIASPAEVDRSLTTLKSQSAVVVRKYNNSFGLWEGSDVDLDERVREARSRLFGSATTADFASKYLVPRAIVARRHSFETGSLRYFRVSFVSANGILAELEKPRVDAAGTILIVFPENPDEIELVKSIVHSPAVRGRHDVLVGMPEEIEPVRDSVREFACLDWVKHHTPELEGDQTARRELRARVAVAQRRMEDSFEAILAAADGGATACRWFSKGRLQRIASRRALHEHLSEICDALYSATPRIRNELINRRELSSAAAAARRNLIDAMITHASKPELGITGTPPEKSMYLSVLAKPGIHRKNRGGFAFESPSAGSESNITPVWDAILGFFNQSERETLPVSQVFQTLESPPYGVKAGLVPILFCAALLAEDADVAIYEEGSFIPNVTVAVYERLMKSPERFTVQKWRVTGVRAEVFDRLAEMLGRDLLTKVSAKKSVLEVVRPLCRLAAQLNDYVRNTTRLSVAARAVRDVLLRARQPDRLLFVELPEACGAQPFESRRVKDRGQLDEYIAALRAALGELQRCYDDLLAELSQTFGQEFGIRAPLAQIRQAISQRAESLREWAAEPTLKSFINRASDTVLDDTGWLESLAALLAQKPPAVWKDDDRARFEIGVSKTARLFGHLEALAFAGSRDGRSHREAGEEAFRIGITTRDAPEIEKVIRIHSDNRASVERLEQVVRNALAEAGVNGEVELALGALARLTKQMLASTSPIGLDK